MKFKSLVAVTFATGIFLLTDGAHAGFTGSEFASGTGRTLTCQHAKTRAQVAILQNRSIEVRGKATVRESIGECQCDRSAYAEKLSVDTWTCTVNWGLDVQHR